MPPADHDDEHASEPHPADFEVEPDDDDRPASTLKRKSRGGQMIGAAMMGLAEILEPKPKVEVPIEIETPGEPPNIDRDGLDEPWGEGERMVAPPMNDIKAKAAPAKTVKRRRP